MRKQEEGDKKRGKKKRRGKEKRGSWGIRGGAGERQTDRGVREREEGEKGLVRLLDARSVPFRLGPLVFSFCCDTSSKSLMIISWAHTMSLEPG